LFLIFFIAYATVFRYNSGFFLSITTELSFTWLIVSDLLNYLSAVTIGLLLNFYLLALSAYNKFANSLTHSLTLNNTTSTSSSSRIYKNLGITTSVNFSELSFKGVAHAKREALLVNKLFKVKKELDFIGNSTNISVLNNKGASLNGDLELSSILALESRVNKLQSPKSLLSVESAFLLENLDSRFNKTKFTESSIKKTNSNLIISHILESSVRSTLDSASANR
jgi:hypothetical protein